MKKHIKYITALALTAAVARVSPPADTYEARRQKLSRSSKTRGNSLPQRQGKPRKKLDEAREKGRPTLRPR